MLLELIKEVVLNLDGENYNQRFTVKRGNNLSNIFVVTIQRNGEDIDLSNVNARYCINRPDGTQSLSDAVIENNKIKIALTQKDLSEAGLLSCEVILSKNETIVFTSIFHVDVMVSSLHQEKVKNTDDYSSLINTLDRVNELVDNISSLEQQVSDKESLRVTKENIRVENENVRQQNETERIDSFNRIETKSNEIIDQNREHTQNAKVQAQYAKIQGDYAKLQAQRIENADVSQLQESVEDLKGYVGYVESDIYGVEVDFKNNRFTRLAGSKDLNAGENFDKINAYNRKRCILNDSGDVVCYYGDDGYVEDGSKGQVMVEQPKFYYKVIPLELDPITDGQGYHLRKARYYICDTPKQGFKLHPVFIQNGIEKDKIYLSAYEGCIYDVSASKYLLADEQVADFSIDKLSSIANSRPCSGKSQQLTRANSRKLAKNRGHGWSLSTIQSISCTQLLFLIEYAGFNIQEKIGVGLTASSLVRNTGLTSNLGNTTGVGGENSVSYRGEENIYGNIWKWIDGINIYNYSSGDIFIADNNFNDNINTQPYQKTNLKVADKGGYISAIGYHQSFDWLFIPSETKGSSALPIGDYCFFNKDSLNWSVCRIGGYWSMGAQAGLFCFEMYDPSTAKNEKMGTRTMYIH